MAYSMMNTGLKLCLMASYRVEKTWSDLQESLNRVRQQLGFVSRAGWDDLVARDAPSRVHSTPQHNRQKVHSPSHLPRLLTTPNGVSHRPSVDLRRGPWVVVPPLSSEKANGRKGTLRKSVICSSQQPASQPEYSDIRDSAMILCSGRLLPNSASVRQQDHGGNEKRPSGTRSHSPGLQRHPLYLPTEKNFYSKSHLQQIVKLDVLKQQPAVSVLDTLLEEIVSELTLGLIRTVVEELVSNHLTTAAITESLTEVMAETIEPMVAQLVKEAVSEALLEEILQEEMLTEVVDEEMRNVAMLLLTDYDTEIYEQQQQAVRTYASKRLIDMFLLEKLVKIIGSQGRAFSEKIEMDRLLDSWMLDVLLGQYLNITKHNNLTVENVALRDYHTKAFTNVVLDVILMEMSEYMDEDLADLFQYERQMEQTNLIVD
ncbi:uncharacterized protein LOC119954351 isoform X3 [Scyliorhinus canicula]|uniref:uncharacterized protein LOC119954351 isoform X3 n=1 Tax=Scyliorhinus canicula TaxID=7830 RepID=UPI0018F5FA2F|nr:uncharacterized protein LOC119954351 isoform X3 [Scyliorhinus canicula]